MRQRELAGTSPRFPPWRGSKLRVAAASQVMKTVTSICETAGARPVLLVNPQWKERDDPLYALSRKGGLLGSFGRCRVSAPDRVGGVGSGGVWGELRGRATESGLGTSLWVGTFVGRRLWTAGKWAALWLGVVARAATFPGDVSRLVGGMP